MVILLKAINVGTLSIVQNKIEEVFAKKLCQCKQGDQVGQLFAHGPLLKAHSDEEV
jgi:hypothetical protein